MKVSEKYLDAAKSLIETIRETFAEEHYMNEIGCNPIPLEGWGKMTTYKRIGEAINASIEWKVKIGKGAFIGNKDAKETRVQFGDIIFTRTKWGIEKKRQKFWISDEIIRKRMWSFYKKPQEKNLLGLPNLNLLAIIAGKRDFFDWMNTYEDEKEKRIQRILLSKFHHTIQHLTLVLEYDNFIWNNQSPSWYELNKPVKHNIGNLLSHSIWGKPEMFTPEYKLDLLCWLYLFFWDMLVNDKSFLNAETRKFEMGHILHFYNKSPYLQYYVSKMRDLKWFSGKLMNLLPTKYEDHIKSIKKSDKEIK